MKMQAIKEIARRWSVDCRIGRTKADIIRDIQEKEGYSPCFGTKNECDQMNCFWSEDCLE